MPSENVKPPNAELENAFFRRASYELHSCVGYLNELVEGRGVSSTYATQRDAVCDAPTVAVSRMAEFLARGSTRANINVTHP